MRVPFLHPHCWGSAGSGSSIACSFLLLAPHSLLVRLLLGLRHGPSVLCAAAGLGRRPPAQAGRTGPHSARRAAPLPALALILRSCSDPPSACRLSRASQINPLPDPIFSGCACAPHPPYKPILCAACRVAAPACQAAWQHGSSPARRRPLYPVPAIFIPAHVCF